MQYKLKALTSLLILAILPSALGATATNVTVQPASAFPAAAGISTNTDLLCLEWSSPSLWRLKRQNSTNLLYYIRSNLTYLTPQQFGAVGDGVTDDTLAFSNAVRAINAGPVRSLLLGNKTYKLNGAFSITASGVSILGDGAVINHNAATNIFQIRQPGAGLWCMDTTFRGFTINGTFNVSQAAFHLKDSDNQIGAGGYNTVIENVQVFSCANAVYATNSYMTKILNCRFQQSSDAAIKLYKVDSFKIEGSDIGYPRTDIANSGTNAPAILIAAGWGDISNCEIAGQRSAVYCTVNNAGGALVRMYACHMEGVYGTNALEFDGGSSVSMIGCDYMLNRGNFGATPFYFTNVLAGDCFMAGSRFSGFSKNGILINTAAGGWDAARPYVQVAGVGVDYYQGTPSTVVASGFNSIANLLYANQWIGTQTFKRGIDHVYSAGIGAGTVWGADYNSYARTANSEKWMIFSLANYDGTGYVPFLSASAWTGTDAFLQIGAGQYDRGVNLIRFMTSYHTTDTAITRWTIDNSGNLANASSGSFNAGSAAMTANLGNCTNLPVTGLATTIRSTNCTLYAFGPTPVVAGVVANVPHNLGYRPSFYKWTFRCATAESGYDLGDDIDVHSIYQTGTYAYANVVSAGANSTNCFLSLLTGVSFAVPNKTNGASASFTPANWKAYVTAW